MAKEKTNQLFSILSYLFRWDGTIDRGPYLLIGIIGFAIKHNLDRLVASAFYNKPWGIFNYFIPPAKALNALSGDDRQMLLSLLGLSIPFIWVGVVCTLRRLRSIGLPLGYFLLHGSLVALERFALKRGFRFSGGWGRVWTFFWLIAPLPILFHGPFLRGVVWPLIGVNP